MGLKNRRAEDQEIRSLNHIVLLLRTWEVAYRKESFYNGLRALLELSRDAETKR